MIRLIANKQDLRPFKETRQPEMAKTKLLYFKSKENISVIIQLISLWECIVSDEFGSCY